MSFFSSLMGDNKSRIITDRVSDTHVTNSEPANVDLFQLAPQENFGDPVSIDEPEKSVVSFSDSKNDFEHDHPVQLPEAETKNDNQPATFNAPVSDHRIKKAAQEIYDESPELTQKADSITTPIVDLPEQSMRYKDHSAEDQNHRQISQPAVFETKEKSRAHHRAENNHSMQQKLLSTPSEDKKIVQELKQKNSEPHDTDGDNQVIAQAPAEVKNKPDSLRIKKLDNKKLPTAEVGEHTAKINHIETNSHKSSPSNNHSQIQQQHVLADSAADLNSKLISDVKMSAQQMLNNNEASKAALNPLSEAVNEAAQQNTSEKKNSHATQKPVKEIPNTQYIIQPRQESLDHQYQNSWHQKSPDNKSQQDEKVSQPQVTIGKLDITVMAKQVEKTNKKMLHHNNSVSQLLYLRGI